MDYNDRKSQGDASASRNGAGHSELAVRTHLEPGSAPAGRAVLPHPPLQSPQLVTGLIRGVKRRYGVALGLGVVCASAATVLAWALVPAPKFSASSTLQVKSTPPRFAIKTADLDALDGRVEFKNYQLTQEKLIKSRYVLLAALRDPKVKGLASIKAQVDPITWLQGELVVIYTGEVLQISMSGNNPAEIITLVNAVTDAYMREVVNAERNERLDRMDKLKKLYDTYQESLKGKRENLRQLAVVAGSNEKQTLALKQQISEERLGDAQKELFVVQSDIRKAQAELASLPPRKDEEVSAPADNYASVVALDPFVIGATGKLRSLLSEYENARRITRSPSDPALARARTRYLDAKKDLDGLREQLRANLERQQIEAGQKGGDDVREQLQRKLEFLKQFEKSQQDEVTRLAEGTRNFNKTTLDLEAIQDEIENANNAARQLGQQKEAINVELQAPTRVRLLEPAEVPTANGSRKRYATIGLAALASFASAVLAVAWRESQWHRVDSVDEVVHGVGMNLVGVLPEKTPSGRRLSAPQAEARRRYQENLLIESIDATRAVLLRAARTDSIRAVMITSAQMGEGKSTLACHLATSLARTCFRTLLIDCDLRKPTVHEAFGLSQSPGMGEILRGDAGLFEVVRTAGESNLSVVTAGRCDAAAVGGLLSDRVPGLLERAKDHYDFIIVDSAPVLPVADSLHLCQHVDAVIFSVLRDVSRLPKIHVACQRMSAFGAHILGAVLAGVRIEGDETSYTYVGQQRPDTPVEAEVGSK